MPNENCDVLLAEANCGDLAKAFAARERIAELLKARELSAPVLRSLELAAEFWGK